jgi:hypothetical protein
VKPEDILQAIKDGPGPYPLPYVSKAEDILQAKKEGPGPYPVEEMK